MTIFSELYREAYHSSESIWDVITHLQEVKAWKVIYDVSKEIFEEAQMDYPAAFRRLMKELFPSAEEEQAGDDLYTYLIRGDVTKVQLDRIFLAAMIIYEDSWDIQELEGAIKITVNLTVPDGNLLEALTKLHQHMKGSTKNE